MKEEFEYNYVGIDSSISSTGLVINGKLFNYCKEVNATNKSGLSKWFKMCDHLINLRFTNYSKYTEYSAGELGKLQDYDTMTDMIVDDILKNIDPSKPTRVALEGLSYQSDPVTILDLSAFSTLLRLKLLRNVTTDIIILAPTSLKLEACKLTYPPIDIGKKKEKLVWKNNKGISGGKFLKQDILLALVENTNLNTKWVNHLREVKDELLSLSTLAKPYEDLNDSYILYLLLCNKQI